MAVVGESGSGKTTLFAAPLGGSAAAPPPAGCSITCATGTSRAICLRALGEADGASCSFAPIGLRASRSSSGAAHDGVGRGANVGERLMAIAGVTYGHVRRAAGDWLAHVRDRRSGRSTRAPDTYSGRHAAAAARSRAPNPRHPAAAGVHGNEPTGGLDVSVQAPACLDLLRGALFAEAARS